MSALVCRMLLFRGLLCQYGLGQANMIAVLDYDWAALATGMPVEET